jgi:hypothetical protein
MIKFKVFDCLSPVVLVILTIGCILVSGCASTSSGGQNNAVLTASATATQVSLTPTTTQAAQIESISTPSDSNQLNYLTYTNEEYKISISYPETWEKQEPNTIEMRDYGEETKNIVNFFSPGKVPNYITFSIDVDPQNTKDNETYFNTAVLALQDHYHKQGYDFKITKTNTQVKISEPSPFFANRLDYALLKGTEFSDSTTDAILIFTIPKVFSTKGLPTYLPIQARKMKYLKPW